MHLPEGSYRGELSLAGEGFIETMYPFGWQCFICHHQDDHDNCDEELQVFTNAEFYLLCQCSCRKKCRHTGGTVRKFDGGRCPLLCADCYRIIGYWVVDHESDTITEVRITTPTNT